MSQGHQELWAKCLAIIKDNINEQSYRTWFLPIKPVKLENNVLTIQVPSQFFYEWIEEHYVTLLKRTIRHFLGQDAKLEYSVIVENNNEDGKRTAINYPTSSIDSVAKNPPVSMPIQQGKTITNPFVIPGLKKISLDPNLNANYTFDNFVEGDCNRLARNAGYSVATKPGFTSYNPLLLYGGTGLGKTHLAQAIGNEVKKYYPDKVVLYVPSEKFTNQFVESVKNQSANDFVNFYQLVDVLIVDDIQFLGNKDKTQEIFFQVFNHLHQNGKQIILTCDTAPKDLRGMDERMLSRFKWGLSADMGVPDLETRMAILQKKMYNEGIEINEEIVNYI
ncbi:MAG: chromosomal replication initiator protein DnaA, partial [Bacteroidia bacterium]|nr:chromosomal replication initiator protein DnaA [Bacteroidia bacterium]